MAFHYPIIGGSSGGVTSLNSETGDINLVAGTGISITPSGTNITIAATSGVTPNLISVLTAGNSTGGISIVPITSSAFLRNASSTEIMAVDGNQNIQMRGVTGGTTQVATFGFTANGLFQFLSVPTYANDAAATTGGLVSGNLYKTTTAGITSLNIVP